MKYLLIGLLLVGCVAPIDLDLKGIKKSFEGMKKTSKKLALTCGENGFVKGIGYVLDKQCRWEEMDLDKARQEYIEELKKMLEESK